jgi:hypothetical protein
VKHNGDERNGDISDHISYQRGVGSIIASDKDLVDAFVWTELKLAEEASVIIFFGDQEEIFVRIDFREWFISMPFRSARSQKLFQLRLLLL